MIDPVRLEEEARQRFVRWDSAVWNDLLAGPAYRLAQQVSEDLLESYLRLATTGIGLGYLFPASAGVNFFTLAWTRLIPEYLGQVPAASRATTLAELWNLAENLESGPPWLRLVLVRQAETWDSLQDLESRLLQVQAAALEAPATDARGGSLVWLYLADQDRRFLPGTLHFVAPSIVCVHDRHADPVASEVPTLGVWLAREPVVLGAMSCKSIDLPRAWLAGIETLGAKDVRWSPVYSSAENDWRAAATLVTSQFLVVTA